MLLGNILVGLVVFWIAVKPVIVFAQYQPIPRKMLFGKNVYVTNFADYKHGHLPTSYCRPNIVIEGACFYWPIHFNTRPHIGEAHRNVRLWVSKWAALTDFNRLPMMQAPGWGLAAILNSDVCGNNAVVFPCHARIGDVYVGAKLGFPDFPSDINSVLGRFSGANSGLVRVASKFKGVLRCFGAIGPQ